MPTYTLRYDDDGQGLPKRIEFESPDSKDVLAIAAGEAWGRIAELLEDSKPLCKLVHAAPEAGGLWVLLPATRKGCDHARSKRPRFDDEP